MVGAELCDGHEWVCHVRSHHTPVPPLSWTELVCCAQGDEKSLSPAPGTLSQESVSQMASSTAFTATWNDSPLTHVCVPLRLSKIISSLEEFLSFLLSVPHVMSHW